MSLFSSSKLQSAWSTRTWELQAQNLQDSSDLLYDYLRREFVTRRQSLQTDLLEVIRTARSHRDLQIPLWTYHTTVLPKLPSEDYEKVVGHLRRHGYEWSIGQVNPHFNPEEIELWAWNWQWKTRPVTVNEIVKKTDLLQRLALLFGTDYRVVATPVAVKTVDGFDDLKVYKTQLQLHYFPNGLHQHLLDSHANTARKYENYAAPVHEGYVHLWTGVPSVVIPPLPASGSVTPPPSAPAEAPPVLPKRSNGGGVELLDEVSRRLDYSQRAGVYTYEGTDALERAARDLVSGSVCHCDYHNEW